MTVSALRAIKRNGIAPFMVFSRLLLRPSPPLLGHGSMAMTLRYAHLAPDQKREAVDKLLLP